jgi:hypothetical protein
VSGGGHDGGARPEADTPGSSDGVALAADSEPPDLAGQRDTDTDELDAYLDVQYGDDEGYAILAIGTGPYRDSSGKYKHTNWRQIAWEWPAQWAELAAAIRKVNATADVYLCTELMQTKDRSKGNEVSRRRIHADVDIDIDTGRVRKIGGYAVGSGTGGHGHVYVELAESVNERKYTALARLLGSYLGAKDSRSRPTTCCARPARSTARPP